jgi:tetratricopeptide (TPR) repeat protein
MLVDHYRSGNTSLMQQYMVQFVQSHPDNISGYMLAGEIAHNTMQYAEAEQLLKKAIEFSPTNYNLIGTLAMIYSNHYTATGNLMYKNLALEKLERALKYAPTSNRMKEEYAELKGLHSDD